MKETVMKKIFAIVVSLMTLLMFSGVALSAQPAAPEKKKTAKVKKVHLQKSEYTNGPHVTIMGGVAFLTDSDVSENNKRGEVETDLGYALGVAAGYRFDAVRVEAELGYQKNEVDDVNGKNRTGDIKAYSLLVNGYYDLVRGKKIVPFITAGIGAAKVDADVNNFAHVDDIGLAYQVGAGFYYTITDNLHIELKYRFMGVAEIDGFDLDNLNPEFATHNVLLGLRYRF
jgi:OmpA-OmpF porin, OOP family